MPSLAKLGHVALVTPDMEKSLWFWGEVLGLEEVERVEDVVYLRGWGEFQHHSLSLREGPQGIEHIGWQCGAPEDVAAYSEQLQAAGAEVTYVDAGQEPGQGEAVRFILPGGGHPFEIYHHMERPLFEDDRRSRLKNQTARPYRKGISPRAIDHVNIWCANPQAAVDFASEQLGFKMRELVRITHGPLVGAWMSVTSLVHDTAFLGDPRQRDGRFHHLAYYVDSQHDILRAMELIHEAGLQPDLGPGRHGISQAMFVYVRDPGSGHRLEVFSGGYHIFDADWEPIVWTEADMKEGLVWWGEPYMPGTGHVMDETSAC
jgi:biphenyl-2,3-diol 1,2-dioxygenase